MRISIDTGGTFTDLVCEDKKNKLVVAEKNKILGMYSLSHYDKVRRSIAIKFLNE